MWTLNIKSGIWDLTLRYGDIHDACELIEEIVKHSETGVTFSIVPEKEGAEEC